jgi:hypothetical protein
MADENDPTIIDVPRGPPAEGKYDRVGIMERIRRSETLREREEAEARARASDDAFRRLTSPWR